MADKVLTAPLAVIRVNTVAIGKMRTIRVTENIQRGNVQGLGELIPDEKPPLSWAGTLSCDFYNIEFKKSQIPGAIVRNVNTLKQWTDSVLLQEDGVTVDIYKKIPQPGQPTAGLIASQEAIYTTVKGLFLDSESFDIAEGSVSGRNQSFQYLFPVVFPI